MASREENVEPQKSVPDEQALTPAMSGQNVVATAESASKPELMMAEMISPQWLLSSAAYVPPSKITAIPAVISVYSRRYLLYATEYFQIASIFADCIAIRHFLERNAKVQGRVPACPCKELPWPSNAEIRSCGVLEAAEPCSTP